ncbi:MAG: helix-turn-helix transcriptional regulator [Pseudolabrys sp.]
MGLNARHKARGKNSLTARESEVLTWVARGKSVWEVGEILNIAKRTVDEHVHTAVRKLGARSTVRTPWRWRCATASFRCSAAYSA